MAFKKVALEYDIMTATFRVKRVDFENGNAIEYDLVDEEDVYDNLSEIQANYPDNQYGWNAHVQTGTTILRFIKIPIPN